MKINSKIDTGLDALDTELDGGLSQGTVATIITQSDSQGEVMFDKFTNLYPTLYITLEQSPVVLNRRISQRSSTTLDEQDHINVSDLSTIKYEKSIIDEVDKTISNFKEVIESSDVDMYTIIIDPVDKIERMGDEHIEKLFDVLHRHIYGENMDTVNPCVIYLHALDNNDSSTRDVTQHLSDTTMRLFRQRNGVKMEYFLFVLKNRFGKSLDSGLKVNVGNSINVDTSRNI